VQQHMFSISFEDINGVNVIFDTEKCIIHVMELDHDFGITMIESMDRIQEEILNRISQYAGPCRVKKWYLYDIQGKVSQYTDGTLEEMELSHSDINQHFAGKMKMRLVISLSKQ
jgi:hypothetical protein